MISRGPFPRRFLPSRWATNDVDVVASTKRGFCQTATSLQEHGRIPDVSYVDLPKISEKDESEYSQSNDSIDATLADALQPFFRSESPVVLGGYLHANEKWTKAMESWQDRHYLTDRIGSDQHFDVEIGHYNKGENVTIPFSQYVEYLNMFESMYGTSSVPDDNNEADSLDDPPEPSSEHILYLAQRDLPAALAEDVRIPTLCSDPKFGMGEGKQYQCMFWMGPPFAFSPLHYDPLSNLLIQVVGRKRVILIDPTHPEVNPNTLYAGEEYGQQYNTSSIHNLDEVDRARFPQAPPVHVVAQQATLHPGDILFIPEKWWHSAKSLDFSISVNSWWR